MRTFLKLSLLAAAAMVAVVPAAFADMAKVRLAYFVSDSMLPALYAKDKGYFTEAGIDLDMIAVQGGPAVVAAIASGEADIGYSAFVPPINGRINGVPVKLFLVLSHEAEPDHKFTFITASKASGITTLAGVKGKKISMNANGGLCELMWRDQLAAIGMKLEDAQMVVLPFPEQEAALEQGNVDAACTINPFHASMLTNPKLAPVDLAKGMLADLKTPVISDGVYASETYLAEHSAQASGFAKVMDRARKELLADPAALEAASVKYLELTPEAAKHMVLPIVTPSMAISGDDVQKVLDAMIKSGMQPGPLKGSDFVAEVKY